MQQEWKFTLGDSLVLSIARKIWRKKAVPVCGVGKSSPAPLPALPPDFMGFHAFECSQKYDFLARCTEPPTQRRARRSEASATSSGKYLPPGKG